jgi:hypothetical protein
MHSYPETTRWRFRSRSDGHEITSTMALAWECSYSPISDDFYPDDTSAEELYHRWLAILEGSDTAWHESLGRPWLDLWWLVEGDAFALEAVPFPAIEERRNFLDYWTWPRDAETGEPLNWNRLPVGDQLWIPGRADKGGFVQSATGWKPSALQPVVNVDVLGQARGE